MAQVDHLAARAEAYKNKHGTPVSIEDLLTLAGLDNDFNERKSAKAALQRALKKGGKLHHLLGSVIAPSPTGPGPKPTWAGDAEPRPNTLPAVSFTTGKLLKPVDECLEKNAFKLDGTGAALTDLRTSLATASRKLQREAAEAVRAQSNEAIYWRMKAELQEKHCDDLRKMTRTLQELAKKITDGGSPPTGGTVALPSGESQPKPSDDAPSK
jgi:hypothetical protein